MNEGTDQDADAKASDTAIDETSRPMKEDDETEGKKRRKRKRGEGDSHSRPYTRPYQTNYSALGGFF